MNQFQFSLRYFFKKDAIHKFIYSDIRKVELILNHPCDHVRLEIRVINLHVVFKRYFTLITYDPVLSLFSYHSILRSHQVTLRSFILQTILSFISLDSNSLISDQFYTIEGSSVCLKLILQVVYIIPVIGHIKGPHICKDHPLIICLHKLFEDIFTKLITGSIII